MMYYSKKMLVIIVDSSKSVSRRDVAQLGSAFVWGAKGRWFKSSHPDQFFEEFVVYMIYMNLAMFSVTILNRLKDAW